METIIICNKCNSSDVRVIKKDFSSYRKITLDEEAKRIEEGNNMRPFGGLSMPCKYFYLLVCLTCGYYKEVESI